MNCYFNRPGLLSLGLCFVFTLPIAENQAQAAFYKCIGADGSTTYNDAPCAADESIQRLSSSARALNRLDCRIARNFAFDAVARMRQDDSAIDIFNAYGGADNISAETRELINYVFSFDSDQKTNAQRIVNLTVERCEAGLLGKTMHECSSFPQEFITRSGGCISARQSEQPVVIQPVKETANTVQPLNAGPSSTNLASGVNDASKPILNAAQPSNTSSRKSRSGRGKKPDDEKSLFLNFDNLD